MKAWIGVDLDCTLAFYDYWRGPSHIGPPVLRMLGRVRDWIRDGRVVRIVTARVHPQNPGRVESLIAINAWCEKYVGRKLEVTWEKDFEMLELWDDRCVQVVPNTGERVDGKE